jgi:hypothetical protein
MSSVRLAALAALLGYAALAAAAVHAQVYRSVGPDGRVTFSDRPPAANGQVPPAQAVPVPANGGNGNPVLPTELRATASRFPVVLYTGKGCGPCDLARAFLTGRGIPFTEKTIATEPDVRALRSLSGDARLPFATLGQQHLVGFAEAEWSQYLDVAGYPKTSALPAGYRNPPPTPLVAVEAPRPVDPTAQAAPAPAAPQPLPSDPSPSNPLGIRF